MTDADPAPRRILITGGSGLIGRPLTAELAAAGYEVVVLSRSPERVNGLPPGARAVGWDAETPSGWGGEADGALGIVHLAGESLADGRWTDAKKQRIWKSRVHSSLAVQAAIHEAAVAPRFLVQASGVNYYGQRGDQVVTEDSPAGEGFLPQVCMEWEEAAADVEELGVRRVVARSGVVLAREGGALPRMALPFKLYVGGRVGSGRQYMSWIHLEDQVAALRFLVEHATASGPFNLTAPHPVTNRELSRHLADVLGRPSLFPVPGFALRLLFGEMAEVLLEGQRVVPERLQRLGFSFRYPRLEEALRDLLD